MDIDWSKSSIEIIPLHDFTSEELILLREIYGSTRQKELELTDWSLSQKETFIDYQFSAQHDYYLKVYPDAFYGLISVDKEWAGRLYLNESKDDLRIIDISLLPEFRNFSYGTILICDLQNHCKKKHKSLSIHVEQFNPAKNLYNRLGFEVAGTYDEVYMLMRWKPKNNKSDGDN
ncbi:MAG: GNAT family N-acetyltransferase [Saprospiraceae bacterium]|nr:GNAT family N-acetyltransferase [Saprospiraceae bacterium]